MSKGFNLTAELNLRGPSNIRTVVADIRRQVGSVSVNINPTVNRQSIRNVASTIRSQLSNITCDVKIRANTSSLRSIGSDIRRQLSGVSANINVRANQSSIRTMAADIRRQLGSINANVNVTFNTATVTAYSGRLVALNNNLNQITASATNATGAINALAAAMRSASSASSTINNTAINVGNINRTANGARASINLATNEIVEFGRQSGLAIRRFSAFSTVTGLIYGVTNAINEGIKSFIDFDLQLTRISQVTGDAKDKLGNVASTITNLSTTLGVSSNELTKTTVTLAQAGLTAKDTATALKALALSALAPSFDDMNQTVEGSIALMRQFGIGAGQLEMALGSVNSVSAKFAVEASDIITAIQRTGGVFAAASKGVSSGTDALNEFIAIFTSIRATTRESAETIATGLRTIFTRIQRAGTIEALKEFGVTLTDLEGKFVGPYIAVQRLSEGLSRLDPRDLKFSQIVEELGGFRQIGKVLPLIQQFATAQDALKVAQQGQGSLATDAAKGQLALAIQIQKVREEFLALIRSIGDTSSFQNIVRVGLDLASALIKVADATKGVLPLLTLFAAFKGITAATQYIGGFSQGIRGTGGARRANEGGRVYAFASGGLVPGSGDRDSVPARLTPGEFVMRKSAVQNIGVDNLKTMNIGGPVKASQLPSILVRSRVKSANSKEARDKPELFKKGYFLTDSDEISFQKNEYGLKSSKNIGAKNFEIKVQKVIGGKRPKSQIAPVDILNSEVGDIEVRNRQKTTKDNVLLDKFLRLRIEKGLPLISNTPFKDNLKFADPISVVYNTGKFTRDRFKQLALGGSIRKFADAGTVTPTAGKQATTSEIIKLLGLETAAKAGGIGLTDVYTILNKRTPTPEQAASKAAILAEFTKKQNRLSGAKQARTTRITSKGLLFGAAGMLGAPFAPINKKIISDQLKAPVDVRIVSGIMDPKVASATEQSFTSSLNKAASRAAKKVMIADILAKAGLGKELNLDFDRTLAFGADNILSDPKTPKFAEFGDRNKVGAALKGAKLSLLGKELAGLVSSKPELLGNLRLITARPSSTLDLVQEWLSSKGLPIPLSQFKGLGGPGVSGSQIAKLKAALLSPGSLFVDDDARNIKAAKARSKEAITSYRYGNRKISGNANAEATAQGILFEKMIQKLGGPGALKGQGMDFPQGLKGAAKYFGIPANIATDAKRTISGPSTVEDNIITYLKVKGYAEGGSSTDMVPALVSNGEAFVPPEKARKIGYSTLNRMNQADRNGMGRFAGGGISLFKGPGSGTSDSIGPIGLPVGGFVIRAAATKALGLSKGGSVQRFAFGGAPRAVPDISGMSDARALSVVGVTDNVTSQLENLATVLQELGVRSSDSARIIQSGTQATYQQAIRATEADIRRARLAGASAEQIAQAENQLADIRRQSQQDITTRRTLGRLSGAQLQQIDSGAQEERNRLRETRTAQLRSTGMSQQDINTQLASEAGDIDRAAYRRATRRQGINLGASGLTGNDAQSFVRQSMGDPRILRQMDQQLRQQLRSSTEYTTASRTQQRQMRQSVEEEIRTRRDIVNNLARQRGQQAPGGDQRGNFGGMLGLSFGLQGVGSLLASQINASSSSSNASTAGAIQGGVTGLATGGMLVGGLQDMLGSRLSPAMSRLLGGFGLAATAAAAVGQAFIEARNAAIEFEKNFQQKKLETAISDSQQLFEKLNSNIKNVDIQRSLTAKLAEAGDAAKAGIDANNKLAKAFWVNLFDAFGSADQGAASQRSEILEKKGIMAYFRSTDLFGGGDRARSREYETLIPEKARENSKSFAETSKLTTDLIGAKIQGGSSVEDIFKDPAWKKQAEVIARANTAIEQEILSIRNNASISNLEKEARINNIIAINAEQTVRQQAAVIERQQQLKSLDNTTNVYTRSLERMFQNMEQSIGRASFSLEQMSKDVDLVSDALQGQAKVGGIALTAINALQNPRAYSDQAVSGARNVAAESFGMRSPEMVSLLGVGEKIESTVMSTINKSVNKNPGITEEALGSIVGRDVKEALTNLSLPPDLVDKLSGEVGNVLKDFKKLGGEDKLDYTQLSEKLGQLNRVVDSSRRAQEVAIKALEHYQNALNVYSQNINKTIDLQISANQRLRKSTDIVADTELSLAKTLGKNISLENARATVNSRVVSRTGGVTNPNDIFDSINKLENTRTVQQAEQRNAAERGVSGQADFIKFTKNLADTNVSLRENIEALKYLADNTDIAASAMEKIQEAQQKASGRASFIEKLVTSTPEELDSLSGAFQRLQNNANGQINTINRSVGAQRAYYEALQNGATMMEAMKAAQGAFVNERKETLGALNDIIPFLGNGQQAGNVKANVLESMMQESGMGMSPLFQQVLNTLRNPEMDPATQAAIAEYREGNNLQARANALLAQLDSNLARDIASQSAKALANALSDVKVNFEGSELKDLVNLVQQINGKLPLGAAPAVPKASGGIIYAAAGQAIDFKSQGTDTVPAMLTPGEFVVNRAATQSNLPLLQAINSNKYSSGGAVRYYSAGGYVSRNFKDEYQKSSSETRLSKESYIDPNTDLEEIKPVFYGPTRFTRSQTGINGQKSLDGLDPNGKAHLGAAPIIYQDQNSKLFEYDDRVIKPVYVLSNSMGYVLSNNIEAKKKKINVSEWESKYKPFITDRLLNKIGDPNNILTDLSDIGRENEIPQAQITRNIYNPNILTDKPIGLITADSRLSTISVDDSSMSSKNTLKIYYSPESSSTVLSAAGAGAVAGGAIGAAAGLGFFSAPAAVVGSIAVGAVAGLGAGYKLISELGGSPDTVSATDPGDGKKLYQKPSLDTLKISTSDAENYLRNKNGIQWLKSEADLSTLLKDQEKNKKLFEISTDFGLNADVANIDKYFDYEDTDLRDLRENLFKLYNGANSVGIPKNQLAFLDIAKMNKSNDTINLLTALNASYRQSIKNAINNKDAADEFKKKYSNLVIGGVFPDQLKTDKYIWSQNTGLSIITDKGDEERFPWIAGASPEQILSDFKAEETSRIEDLKKRYNITERFYPKADKFTLSLPDPIGSVDLPYTMHYTEYSGPRVAVDPTKADEYGFNTKGQKTFNKIKLITPINSIDDPFADLSKQKTIYTPVRWDFLGELSPEEIFDKNNIDLSNNAAFKNLIGQNNTQDIKDKLKEQLAKTNYEIKLDSLIDTSLPAFANTRLFKDNASKQTYKFSIGEYLNNVAEKNINDKINKAKNAAESIDDKGQLAADVIKDNDLPRAVKDLAKLSLGVFGRRRVPGLPGNWLYNSIRGVLQKPFRDSGVAKQAAGYTSNIFNNFGAYLSKLAPMTRNVNVYQQLKELFTLGSGAAMAFAGLASGDTRMIAQFTKLRLNPEDLFRTLGGASLFGRISSTQLSGDYKAILGQQLEGAKIKTVGANGTLSPASAAEAIPEKYNDLINIAFNPYNEFPSKDTRKGIIEKLTTDMINARDQMGLPYFDSNTQRFLYGNMSSLYNWYGGNGVWEGQDYFFDKNVDPDNAKRTQQVIDSLRGQAGQDAYSKGNVAHNTLGFASRYGSLPTDKWFVQRREAGLNAEAQPDKNNEALRFATGGVVYAQNGQMINFQPRGTDTVPAMLTPGEFVINRAATQQNLPLLHAINSGAKPYSSGGVVYAAGGALIGSAGDTNINNVLSNTLPIIPNILNKVKQSDKIPSNLDTINDNVIKNYKQAARLNNNTTELNNKVSLLDNKADMVLYGLNNVLGGIISPYGRNQGGIVYAANGTLVNYQPRGTDTVPAMLTPGEFVVNAQATKANLPLLQSINKNKGGMVYAARGGKIPLITTLKNNNIARSEMLARQADAAKQWMVTSKNKADANEFNQPLDKNGRVIPSTGFGGLMDTLGSEVALVRGSRDEAEKEAKKFGWFKEDDHSVTRASVVLRKMKLQTKKKNDEDVILDELAYQMLKAPNLFKQTSFNTDLSTNADTKAQTIIDNISGNPVVPPNNVVPPNAQQNVQNIANQLSLGKAQQQFLKAENRKDYLVQVMANTSEAINNLNAAPQPQASRRAFDNGQNSVPATKILQDQFDWASAEKQGIIDVWNKVNQALPWTTRLQKGPITQYSIDNAGVIPPRYASKGGIIYAEDGSSRPVEQPPLGVNARPKNKKARVLALSGIPKKDRTEQQNNELATLRAEAGFKDNSGKINKTAKEEAIGQKLSNDRNVEQYTRQYIQSGSNSPEGWLKNNYPGMKGQRFDATVEALYQKQEEIAKNKRTNAQFLLTDNTGKHSTYGKIVGVGTKDGKQLVSIEKIDIYTGEAGKTIEVPYERLSPESQKKADLIIKRNRAIDRQEIDIKDNTGKYSTKGYFEDFDGQNNTVTIIKSNGKKKVVPLDRLSKEDRELALEFGRKNDADRAAQQETVHSPPGFFSHGGMVYAENGMLIPYQPRGTDTVPAMLTPGEFVINRAATQQHLPLLKAINSGQKFMNNGGILYRAEGGTTSPKWKVTDEEANIMLAQGSHSRDLIVGDTDQTLHSQHLEAANRAADVRMKKGQLTQEDRQKFIDDYAERQHQKAVRKANIAIDDERSGSKVFRDASVAAHVSGQPFDRRAALGAQNFHKALANANSDRYAGVDKYRAETKQKAEAEEQERARIREEIAQTRSQAEVKQAEKEKYDSLWVNSSNPIISGLGYAGGLGQATGEMAYGAANVVAGAGISVAGRAYQAGAYLAGSESQQAAGAAFAQVGEQAVAQGAYTAVEFGQAVAGRGPIQSGDKTLLHKGDDQRVEMAGSLGTATRAFQNIGYAGSQLAPAVAGMANPAAGASSLTKAARAFSALDNAVMSPGTVLSGAGKVLGAADKAIAGGRVAKGLNAVGANRALSAGRSAIDKGRDVVGNIADSGLRAVGKTEFGKGVQIVVGGVKDTAASFNPFRPKAERSFISQNMDAAYGALPENASKAQINLANRYGRLTGGDPTRASSVLRERAKKFGQQTGQRADDFALGRAPFSEQIGTTRNGNPIYKDQMTARSMGVDRKTAASMNFGDELSKDEWQNIINNRRKKLLDTGAFESATLDNASELLDMRLGKKSFDNIVDPTRRREILTNAKRFSSKAQDIVGIKRAPRSLDEQLTNIKAEEMNIYGPSYKAASGDVRKTIDRTAKESYLNRTKNIRMQQASNGLNIIQDTPMSNRPINNVFDNPDFSQHLNSAMASNGSIPTSALSAEDIRSSLMRKKISIKEQVAMETITNSKSALTRQAVDDSVIARKFNLDEIPTISPKENAVLDAVTNAKAASVKQIDNPNMVQFVNRDDIVKQLKRDRNSKYTELMGDSPYAVIKNSKEEHLLDSSDLRVRLQEDPNMAERVVESFNKKYGTKYTFRDVNKLFSGDRNFQTFIAESMLAPLAKTPDELLARMQQGFVGGTGEFGSLEKTLMTGGKFKNIGTKTISQLDAAARAMGGSFSMGINAIDTGRSADLITDVQNFLEALNSNNLSSITDSQLQDFATKFAQIRNTEETISALQTQNKARGGVVYANSGTLIPYQPRGTDTVPAMLTPGEFVVNAKATAQHLPLLKSINNGQQNMSVGGIVYAEDGAFIPYKSQYAKNSDEKRKAYEQEMQRRRDAYQEEMQRRRDNYAQRGSVSNTASVQNNQQTPATQQNAVPQIAPQTVRAVNQAANAAFDQRNAGDVNKQLTIFGTLLTGVNQLLVQHGAVLQQQMANNGSMNIKGNTNNQNMIPGQNSKLQNGVSNNTQGGNTPMDGLSQFTTTFGQFIQQLNSLKLPEVINIQGNHKVEVVINGGAVLASMQEGVKNLVLGEVNKAMSSISKQTDGAIA